MPNTLHAYNHVTGYYFPLAIAVFAAVVLLLAIFMIMGARRSHSSRRNEAPRMESAYAVMLAVIAALMLTLTFTAESPIDHLVSHPSLRVRVTAAQWNWSFTYANGKTVDAISTWSPPVAEVPVGVEVEFDARSEDVIHGFYVPALRYQRQVFPGYVSRFDLIFTRPGTYVGECSVYCGTLHSYMHFAIRAVSAAAFRAWLAKGGTTS